jgi:hypothetical protein
MFIIKKNLNKFAAKEIKPFSFRALPFHVETEPLQAYQLQIHVQLDGRMYGGGNNSGSQAISDALDRLRPDFATPPDLPAWCCKCRRWADVL